MAKRTGALAGKSRILIAKIAIAAIVAIIVALALLSGSHVLDAHLALPIPLSFLVLLGCVRFIAPASAASIPARAPSARSPPPSA